jgi:hypothetical protein
MEVVRTSETSAILHGAVSQKTHLLPFFVLPTSITNIIRALKHELCHLLTVDVRKDQHITLLFIIKCSTMHIMTVYLVFSPSFRVISYITDAGQLDPDHGRIWATLLYHIVIIY